MPTKIGISDNNFKVIIKNSNNHYSVIQKTNKDYLCYDLKSGSEFGGNGEIETDYFYTSLTCTNTNFKKVLYPQYIELNDEENQDYFIQATQGLITQYNDSGMLKMDIRFDKFDGDYIGKDLWIKSYDGKYRKPYYGLLGKTNIVKNITFNKCLDFYRV